MVNEFTKDTLQYPMDQNNPIEFLFIDSFGRIHALFKSQLGKVASCDDEYIYLNNHFDMLYYYIKKQHLISDDELFELRKKNSFIDYAKVLIEKNYVVICNFTYYGVIKKDELDLLIVTNCNFNERQFDTFKNLNSYFVSNNLHIDLCLFDFNKNGDFINTFEERFTSYNEVISMLNNQKGRQV